MKKTLVFLKKKNYFFKVDCKDTNKVTQIIYKIKPNFIFHLAGQVAVTKSFDDPINDLKENVMTTVNILESIRNLKKNQY